MSSRKLGVDLDLALNRLLQACLENLASSPTHASGRVYYDTVLGYARISDGAAWQRMSFLNDPYARANHTGTQAAATISDLATVVKAYRLDEFAAPNASVAFNSQKITGLANGTNPQDAVTRSQLDAVQAGLDIKASVRAASTANVTVTYSATSGTSGRGQITAAPNTLDGVALAALDRLLLKDQSTAAQDGIWVVTTLGSGANGVWDRATDFDADAEVTSGAFTFVEEGTVNDNTGWTLQTNNPIIIGGASGTALVWAQFSGAGSITAGTGLTKTGNSLDVIAGTTFGAGGPGGGLKANADDLVVDGDLVARWKVFTIGDGSATSFVVNHALGHQYPMVQVGLSAGTFAVEDVAIEKTDTNNCTVRFNTAPASAAYKVTVIG